jgi:hypothetical protein
LKTDFGGLPIAFHLTRGEASDSRNFETLLDIGPISIRAPHSVTRATIPNQTARPPAGAEYARQSRIDPTSKTYPPSFRKFSTRVAPVSSKQSASSNGSQLRDFRNTSLREGVLVEEASLARIRINDFSKRALWDSGERYG